MMPAMTLERWQKLKTLFESALEREGDDRAAFLDQACAEDPSLRLQIEALLRSHERAAEFLEAPVIDVATRRDEDQAESVEGRRIGPYQAIREISHGGMGTVYLAARADGQYKKHVAIKLIRRGMDTDEILRRFRHERQILAALDHPNIARLLDGGTTEDGRPYFVMEYIEGVPIDDYCNTHRLNTAERLKLFRTVCSAVHYAHQNLVVHRDLKPRNILVTADGGPKLLDFGIAKLLNPELSGQSMDATATGLRLMTPDYASPEQVRGELITTASDVYTLGVLLYELLTGHRPYRVTGRAMQEIAQAVCEQEPEKPSVSVVRGPWSLAKESGQAPSTKDQGPRTRDKLRKQLSGDLDNIVLMALRKEPQRRYASVDQFSEDIRRHLEGLPVIARKDTLGYRAGKFVTRHKVGVVAAALVFLVLVRAVVVIAWQAKIAAEQRDRARVEAAKAERISTFLQQMLSSADPNWYVTGKAKGPKVAVEDVLNEAAQRIETELVDQPEVKADLHHTIGNTYRALEVYDAAERHFRAALELRRRLFGEHHPRVAESLYFLGAVFHLKGDYATAEQLFRQALAILRMEPNRENANLPFLVADLAGLLIGKGDPTAAEPLFREALDLVRQ
jgi:tRNA A-37 threonylcarbamoyl transferase component Bud32/tetratricopeptide (TPR) repeat protein